MICFFGGRAGLKSGTGLSAAMPCGHFHCNPSPGPPQNIIDMNIQTGYRRCLLTIETQFVPNLDCSTGINYPFQGKRILGRQSHLFALRVEIKCAFPHGNWNAPTDRFPQKQIPFSWPVRPAIQTAEELQILEPASGMRWVANIAQA